MGQLSVLMYASQCLKDEKRSKMALYCCKASSDSQRYGLSVSAPFASVFGFVNRFYLRDGNLLRNPHSGLIVKRGEGQGSCSVRRSPRKHTVISTKKSSKEPPISNRATWLHHEFLIMLYLFQSFETATWFTCTRHNVVLEEFKLFQALDSQKNWLSHLDIQTVAYLWTWCYLR